jgi:hypothetical protein
VAAVVEIGARGESARVRPINQWLYPSNRGSSEGLGYRVLHLNPTSPPGTARTDVIDAHVGARIRMRRVMLGLPLRQMQKCSECRGSNW